MRLIGTDKLNEYFITKKFITRLLMIFVEKNRTEIFGCSSR